MHLIDLDQYLRRIGHSGSTEPTLETLRVLHLAHASTFPFENLNAWTGRPVSIDLAAIEEKFLKDGRGGYCFEHNLLFAAVLSQLGYQITPLIARVLWMQLPDARPPRTHMLLKVMVDDRPWAVDVGFGGIGQTAPLALDTGEIQATPHEPRRFLFEEGFIIHQALLSADRWETLYTFDLQEAEPIDYQVANWFTSTHPESLFRKTLIVSMVRGKIRLLIAFGEFTRRLSDGQVDRRSIADDADLRNLLIHEFNLPGDDPAVREASVDGPTAF